MATISQAVNQGESLSDALKNTGDFFPVLFREMVAVGEQTGRLDAIFAQLAEHYQYRLKMRRQFLAAITWPMVQLTASIIVIGFLIWIVGIIREANRIEFDPLGLGLYGNTGLAIYATFISIVAAFIGFSIHAVRRGLAWTRGIQYGILRIPFLGGALQTLALARLAWSLNVTVASGMEIRRALRLSLSSTNHVKFTDQIETVDAEIEQGNTIHEAFVQAGCFPVEFLDTVAVGEESGKLDESMAVLARQYQDQAQYAFKTLNIIAGFLVWLIIAAIIIVLIFRMAFFYFGEINKLTNQLG